MTIVKKTGRFKYLYGPVSSWRLGSSLGIDPISTTGKICSFDCLYCQLGSGAAYTRKRRLYVPTEEIIKEIEQLPKDLAIDYFTFSGRGEPTLALNIGEIIRKLRTIRKEKIAVITNASLMDKISLRRELALADFVMAKIDAYDERSFKMINRPARGLKFGDIYNGIAAFKRDYKTRLAIQTMFFDLNKESYKKLAEMIFKIKPDEIQINTPLRRCPVKALSHAEMARIVRYFRTFAVSTRSHTKVISVYETSRKKVKALDKDDTTLRRGRNS